MEIGTNLAKALLAIQAELPEVSKSGRNEHQKYDYADMSDILRVVKPVASKHGIVIVAHIVETKEGVCSLVTRVQHAESSEFIETETPMFMVQQNMQALGSARSYAYKYAVATLLGVILTDDDDDAVAAKAQQQPAAQGYQAQPARNPNYQVRPAAQVNTVPPNQRPANQAQYDNQRQQRPARPAPRPTDEFEEIDQ